MIILGRRHDARRVTLVNVVTHSALTNFSTAGKRSQEEQEEKEEEEETRAGGIFDMRLHANTTYFFVLLFYPTPPPASPLLSRMTRVAVDHRSPGN